MTLEDLYVQLRYVLRKCVCEYLKCVCVRLSVCEMCVCVCTSVASAAGEHVLPQRQLVVKSQYIHRRSYITYELVAMTACFFTMYSWVAVV